MRKLLKNRFGGIILLAIIFLIVSFLTRVTLMIRSFSEIDFTIWELTKSYFTGLFFDINTFLYIAIPFIIINLFISDKFRRTGFYKYSTWFIFFILFYLILFNAVSEYFFWNEFGVRYNFIAVDYLIYTTEVIDNINESYPMPVILSSILISSLGLLFFIVKKKYLELSFLSTSTIKKRLVRVTPYFILLIVNVVFIKQTLAEVSKNTYHIELAKNGIYSFVTAFKNNELDYHTFYIKNDDNENIKLLRELLNDDNSDFTGNENDIKRIIKAEGEEKNYNIMFICVESLGAEYFKYFGSERIMVPHLDSLVDHTIFFTNLYATGTRTVRGLEAIVLSVPPSPGRSIVKRPDNKKMFSIGQIFKERGYQTNYIYGGYGYFDNMNVFFSNNGFTIIDRVKFADEEQTFSNAWGLCDEDLYNKAMKEADRAFTEGKPFFNFIMTTSNHRPFTFPEDKIDYPSGVNRQGGTLYSDFAINQFLNDVKDKPWYENTIFLIIADHCGSSAGRTELPIKEYQIPMLIYNPVLFKPQIIDKLCSQVDVAPTLFGILNWTYESKFFGKDIFKMKAENERAFIGNYQKLGLMKNDKLVILSPMEKISFYKYDRYSWNLEELPMDTSYLERAIAYFQSANYFYKNNLNRWED